MTAVPDISTDVYLGCDLAELPTRTQSSPISKFLEPVMTRKWYSYTHIPRIMIQAGLGDDSVYMVIELAG